MRVGLLERVFSGWLWRLPPGIPAVALTFDDGPDADTTPSLIATLDRLQIPATHFLLGRRCLEAPELVRALRGAGQTIGIHGFEHTSFLLRSRGYQRASIAAAAEAIHEIVHERPSLFRPPFGHFSLATGDVLASLDLTGVLWSLSPRDWQTPPDAARESLRAGLHEGAIIVLHDAHETTAGMTELLPWLADQVRERGWTFESLERFAGCKVK